VEDTCPHCRVVGDFYGVPEFVPTHVRCGSCLGVYLYIPTVWERLDREPYEGLANEVYLRPRWKPDRIPPPSPPLDPREEARTYLARFSVKQLIWMLRSSDYYGPRWEDLRAVLAQKPHVDFNQRRRSAHRRTLAKQNHGMSKSKNR
jgi:hypothetical protein